MDKQSVWKIIVNPHSGSGRTQPIWKKARRLMEERGLVFEEECTKGKRDAVELVKAAAAQGYRRFLAVGGDGTAHEVLEGIGQSCGGRFSDYILGVIPIGSGNDWVKGHAVPRRLSDVIGLIAQENCMMQDVVEVTSAAGSSWMLNVGGLGFDAMVCRRVNARKDRGRKGKFLYVDSLLYNIFHYRPSPVRVRVDGKEVFNGPFYSIAFGIGKYCGGGMRQCPDAVLDDGLIDMTLVPRLNVLELLGRMPRLFDGTLGRVKQLVFARGREFEVEVTGGSGELMEADGEIVASTPVRLHVCPTQLRVITGLKESVRR